MAGRFVHDGSDLCFVPRFAFMEGATYTIWTDGAPACDLARPKPELHPSAEVVAIHPDVVAVPRNLLRLYIHFSSPMSEGFAAAHVRLLDDAGRVLPGALLPAAQELWDPRHKRLTVLLDPARLKRGLAPHVQLGYALRRGAAFRVVVDAAYPDARGALLSRPAERRYDVVADERRRVDPVTWSIHPPARRSVDALGVRFDRPLDHALLARCLRVTDDRSRRVNGTIEITQGGLAWRFHPAAPWGAGTYWLVVDPILEDLAGNSVQRVFDRALGRAADAPGPATPVARPFVLR